MTPLTLPKIDKGVPVPPQRIYAVPPPNRRQSQWHDLAQAMQPGDSVLLTYREASSFYHVCHKLGYKTQTRQEGKIPDRNSKNKQPIGGIAPMMPALRFWRVS